MTAVSDSNAVSRCRLQMAALTGVVALFGVTGCASLRQPYSQLTGERYFHAPLDTYPVRIASVDGRGTLQKLVYVDPGPHQIVVQGPFDIAHTVVEERSITLDVAPCTRYYLVAVKPNRLLKDFEVKVDFQEPVGGCHATHS